MCRIVVLIIFQSLIFYCKGQKQSNTWYFPDGGGINFNTNPPTALNDGFGLLGTEGGSAISDTSGNLLFYIGNNRVINRNHKIMIADLVAPGSCIQNAVVVPFPDCMNKYYIFSSDCYSAPNFWDFDSVFVYSVVDMSGNGGLGAVTQKNTKLFSPTGGNVAAVHHANGQDVWVGGVNYLESKLYAYLVSSGGISGPFISTITDAPNYANLAKDRTLKFSPDGQWLACPIYDTTSSIPYPHKKRLVVAKFNNSSGAASPYLIIDEDANNSVVSYGFSFSPNSRFLYMTKIKKGSNWLYVYQYDMQAGGGNAAAILASGVVIDSTSGGSVAISSMQNAPDGKIYFCDILTPKKLGVINNPDMPGSTCNIARESFPILKNHAYGLPNFIESYFDNKGTFSFVYTNADTIKANFSFNNVCLNDSAIFTNTSTGLLTSVTWKFGDGTSSTNYNAAHKYATAGTYSVSLVVSSECSLDSTLSIITIHPMPSIVVSENTTICKGIGTTLTAEGGISYEWSPAYAINITTGANVVVNPKGDVTYTVSAVVAPNNCKVSKTIDILVDSVVAGFVVDPAGGSIPLLVHFTNTSYHASSYEWYFGDESNDTDKDPSHIYNDEGSYTVKLIAAHALGCKDSLNYSFIEVGSGPQLWFPNAFIPNPSENNMFKVEGFDIQQFSASVYNRWGKLIYQWKDFNGGWDGTYQNQPCAVGVYVCEIEATGKDGLSYKKIGTVVLIR